MLEKKPTDTLFKRMRVFMGPSDWSNYTVEADIRIPEKRRQMGDAGIIAQRYTLVAFGNNQTAGDELLAAGSRRAPSPRRSSGSRTPGIA